NRELEGVTGVQAPDDTTLVFELVSKDPHFLQKLASPYGVVYPRQAVSGTAQNRSFSAVGTGPFKLSQQRGDSLYILVQNKKYRQKGVPAIDRLDIRVRRRESTLFKDLAEGDVHLIPEIGPATMQTVMDSTGSLRSQYRDRFTLDKTEALTYYEFIFYPESAYGLESVIWAMSKADKKGLLPGIPSGLKQINLNVEKNLPSPDTVESPLLTTYADDPFMRYFITQLTNQLQPAGVDLEMSRIRTPNINTAFFFTRHAPLYTGDPPPSISHTLADFSIRQTALRINELKNLSFNKYPWWIDLRRVELPGIDQLQ
ncbi:MAG: ABC transporter substrate-binding protein, partial [Balneolaceae bacterium]|nr:ABC transporter substrate-binding protein [Balneolaceae bacterium]